MTDHTILAFGLYASAGDGVLAPVSPQASGIQSVFWMVFWICLVVFIAVNLFAWWGSRRPVFTEPDARDVIANKDGDRKAAWGVGIAVSITTLTLFAVLVVSLRAGRLVQETHTHNPITINVTGHQWWWEVTYLDSEPDLQITTANEIHVPVHQRIAIVTKSADVIHSFWAPNITGKRDLIPGYASSFAFEIDKAGVYRGQCAEFCGTQHAHMAFLIVAETPDEFEAWKENQLREAAEPADAPTSHGRSVFLANACVMCHTIRGTEAASHVGPDLTHIASRREIAAGSLPNVPGALAGWILDPQSIKPGNHMAVNVLDGNDLNDLLTYLGSLK